MSLRRFAPVLAGTMLLALAGCAPGSGGPAPTPTGTATASPAPTGAPTPTADPGGAEATAAVVVVTASTVSVYGTDGFPLAIVTYEVDAADAAAVLAEALDDEPTVAGIPAVGDQPGPCPAATGYDFGGLLLRSPGSLGSGSALEAIVTASTTSTGVPIETVAGQRVGASHPTFQAAIGEFMVLYETDTRLGFDILNPEAHEWDRIGAYAEFSGGALVFVSAPAQLGFVGGCA